MGINASGAVSVTHAATKPATEGHTAFEMTTPAGVITYVTGTALVAVNKYRLVQLQDGDIRASQAFLGSDVIAITNQDYVAPAKQLDEIAIPVAALNTSLAVVGLKEYVAAARDTTPANQPFPVEEGRAIVRNITTTGYDMLAGLVREINGDGDYERNSDDLFAIAMIDNVAVAGAVTVAATAVLTKGSNVAVFNAAPTGPADDEYISFEPAGLGGGFEDLYQIISGAATTSLVLDRVWQHETQTIAVADMKEGAAVTGAWKFGFAGATDDTHFTTIATEDLEDFVVSTAQAWVQGSGDPASIAAMEEEFLVYAGNTTINQAWEEDFGKATRFTQAAETYGISFIKYKKGTASMAYPNEQTHHVGYIILANDGGSAIAVAPV